MSDTSVFETCGQCSHWIEGDPVGPVTIGQPARGVCFGVPPTPVLGVDPRTKAIGQMNLRAQTLETETACSLFDPRDVDEGGLDG